MTTTALEPIGMIGARRVVGDELRALAVLLAEADWPPWNDPRLEEAVWRLRHTIDEHLDLYEDSMPVIASRLGLDFDGLQAKAADGDQVARWVSVLVGSACEGEVSLDVMAEFLSVHLYADELAYLGLLSRPIGPAQRAAAIA